MNEKLFITKGVGLPGKEYECRVSLLYFRICAFESICIQSPHDIQLHMEFCVMRKNSSNELYTGTGAWVITEQTTNKETKKRLSIQQENRQKHKILRYWGSDRKGFGVNLLESYCETKKCRFGWHFYKVRSRKCWEKNGNCLKKLNHIRKLSLSISTNLARIVNHQPLTIPNRPGFLLSYVQTLKGDH